MYDVSPDKKNLLLAYNLEMVKPFIVLPIIINLSVPIVPLFNMFQLCNILIHLLIIISCCSKSQSSSCYDLSFH